MFSTCTSSWHLEPTNISCQANFGTCLFVQACGPPSKHSILFMTCCSHTSTNQGHADMVCPYALQVLQLQSASTTPQSQPVDYESGIEAMILAILQQTTYSQQVQLADLNSLSLVTIQAAVVTAGQLLSAYSVYLSQALATSANLSAAVGSNLLNETASSSLLPVGVCLAGGSVGPVSFCMLFSASGKLAQVGKGNECMTQAAHSQYVCLSTAEGCAQGSAQQNCTCVCVCVCMYFCLSVCLCVYLSVSLSRSLCFCLCVPERHSCIQTKLGKALCPESCTTCHCLAI